MLLKYLHKKHVHILVGSWYIWGTDAGIDQPVVSVVESGYVMFKDVIRMI